jgi:catechol 2,3-dioxygenase
MSSERSEQRYTSIHRDTQMGMVALSVSDLDRSLAYYTDSFGFALLQRTSGEAILGAGTTPLLVLVEQPGARAWPRGGRSYTGLYHFAVLVPTRADLGRWLRHWMQAEGALPGQGDHLVSEALYLEDPDGHGIEIYRDRPRDQWTVVDGRIRMGAEPVDMQGLLNDAAATSETWTGLPQGTRLGHMHLQVGNIAAAQDFYTYVLGFDVVAQMPSALFVSAGGYHHHLGMNVWHSSGAGTAPEDSVALHFFTVELPSEEAREEVVARVEGAGLPVTRHGDLALVKDPWDHTIVLQVGVSETAEGAAELARLVRGG